MQEEIFSAVVPLLKLLSLTVMGLILAHDKIQIIPRDTFKLLSKFVFALFLPCLIFIDLGFVLGLIVVWACRPPPQFVRFTIVMTMCGNTGNLPIAILGSICHSRDNPFGKDCLQRGVAYVSFAQWVSLAVVYTNIYHMMKPPADEESEVLREPLIANIVQDDEEMQVRETRTQGVRLKLVQKIRVVAEKTSIKNIIIQPPIIASLLAKFVGSVPQVKSFVFGHDAPLSFVTDTFEIFGGAMVPSVMLVLGGMLAEGPKSKLGVKTTISITVARLLVLLILGIGIVCLADKMHLLVDDDAMYKYVLLLQYATLSAILFGAVARMRGYAFSKSSALLFWQHVYALFSLSFYIFIYSKLVAPI
ncbi:protein PIN-LIKES 2 [Tanacetum coccineum]